MRRALIVMLEESEIEALKELSKKEFRSIEKQSAVIIRDQLEKAGLIESSNPVTPRPFNGLKEIND